jgi:hypothetical protein
LRLDDTPGQISAQLAGEHGHSQLNLGHLTHPRIDGRGELTATTTNFQQRLTRHSEHPPATPAAAAAASSPPPAPRSLRSRGSSPAGSRGGSAAALRQRSRACRARRQAISFCISASPGVLAWPSRDQARTLKQPFTIEARPVAASAKSARPAGVPAPLRMHPLLSRPPKSASRPLRCTYRGTRAAPHLQLAGTNIKSQKRET